MLATTPVNQHAVPALRPSSVIVNCVCVSRACEGGSRARVHACVISIASPPVSADAVEAGMHAFKPHSISLQIKNYRESAISAIRAERESVVAPSRSPLVFLRQLVTREIQHLAHAAGARSRGVGSARDLVPRGDDAHLASVGRPRRCRSSCRLIGAWRSCTTRRGRRSRASSDSPGRPYESRACDPRRPSQASRKIDASSPRPCRGR